MKIITLQKIGYNHPSQANWSYDIWSVGLIDTDNNYAISYTVKDAFGADSRFKEAVEKLSPNMKYKFIELKSVYTSTGTQKITGVQTMQDIEGKVFINTVTEWLNK